MVFVSQGKKNLQKKFKQKFEKKWKRGWGEESPWRAGAEQLSIEWELGNGDDGYRVGQARSHTLSQKYQTCQIPPPVRASFWATRSMFSPWNHMPMEHQTQLLWQRKWIWLCHLLFYWLSLTFQKQRWSRHTFTPFFLRSWITGNRQSKERKGLSWSEWRQCVFSTPYMSWATRSQCLTSMGWRYSSSMRLWAP